MGDSLSHHEQKAYAAMTTPYFTHHVFSCSNERPAGHPRGCCKAKNADMLRNYFKARAKEKGVEGIRVNNAGCLDRCELGPVFVIYPEGVWYTASTTADIDEIIDGHLIGGTPVARLMLHNDQTELRAEQKPAS